MIRLPYSVSLFVIIWATQLALSTGRPQQRQFQGGFRPINALRFPDDQVQEAKRFSQPPLPPRDRPQGGRQTTRPQPSTQRPRGPEPPVQPARDTRLKPSSRQQQRPESRPLALGGQSRPQLNRSPLRPSTQRPRGTQGGQQRPQSSPRPQQPRPRQNGSQQQRPQQPNRRGPVIDNNERLPERAFSAPNLFVRPEFNIFGNPIMFDPPMIDEEEELPDFRRAKPKPKPKKRPKTNLGPDLQPRLPVFGQPDAILQATETLRNNDVNHETFLPLGVVNAGVLPLAVPAETKEPKSLGLFPPFAPF